MAIGRSIASLFVRMGLDPSGLKSGAAQARAEVKSLSTDLAGGAGAAGMLQNALGLISTTGLAYAARQVGEFVWELGKAGAQSLQVEQALSDLTRGAGVSMDRLVAAVREAAGGTVNEFETMLALNRGVFLGLGTDVQQWADLMEVARFRARAMGIDTSQALSDITTGIGRESRLILDNLGIILDTDAALAQYAETHNVAAESLDAFQRKEAIKLAVIAEGKAQMAAAGGMTDDYRDSILAAEAALDDLAMTIKESLVPAVAGMADGITQLLDEGRKLEELRDDFQWLIDALAFFESVRGGGAVAEIVTAEMAEDARDMASALEDVWRARELLAKAKEVGSPEQVAYYSAELSKANAALSATGERLKVLTPAYEALAEATHGVGSASATAAAELSGFGGTVGSLSARMEAGARAAQRYAGMIADVGFALNQVKADAARVDLGEIGTGFAAGMGRVESQLLSVAGVASTTRLNAIYGEYQAQLEDLYRNTTGMTDFELAMREEVILGHLEDEVGAFRTTAKEEERILSDLNDTYADIRSTVQSALQPTQVTAEDMGLAAIGEYIDKWDENARRLDAVAARGFEELKAHPDWAGILEIPESVLAGSEEALRAWADRQADAVRGLERPDLINIDAAVAAVQAELDRQAAVELSLDLVTKAAIDKGLVTGEDAKRQVAEALGLEQALPVNLELSDAARSTFVASIGSVDVPVNLTASGAGEVEDVAGLGARLPVDLELTDDQKAAFAAGVALEPLGLPVSLTLSDDERAAFVAGLGSIPVPVTFTLGETEAMEAGGFDEAMGSLVRSLQEGWTASIEEIPWMAQLATSMEAEIKASEARLKEVGAAIGAPLWDGLLGRIRGSGIVNHIVAEVLAALVAETK